jgi:hypothetical protein
MNTSLRGFVTEHAEVRAKERLGRWLTTRHWHSIANQILVEGGVLIRLDHFQREVWAVQLGAVTVHVVWEPASAKIITVLQDTLTWRAMKKRRHHQPRDIDE